MDGPQGTKAGQDDLSTHSERHISKLILKSLLDNTSNLLVGYPLAYLHRLGTRHVDDVETSRCQP